MIVKEFYQEPNEYGENELYQIETPENSISVGQICPEDCTLSRDLDFVYDIKNIIKEAYEAGKRGEELIFEDMKEEM